MRPSLLDWVSRREDYDLVTDLVDDTDLDMMISGDEITVVKGRRALPVNVGAHVKIPTAEEARGASGMEVRFGRVLCFSRVARPAQPLPANGP